MTIIIISASDTVELMEQRIKEEEEDEEEGRKRALHRDPTRRATLSSAPQLRTFYNTAAQRSCTTPPSSSWSSTSSTSSTSFSISLLACFSLKYFGFPKIRIELNVVKWGQVDSIWFSMTKEIQFKPLGLEQMKSTV